MAIVRMNRKKTTSFGPNKIILPVVVYFNVRVVQELWTMFGQICKRYIVFRVIVPKLSPIIF